MPKYKESAATQLGWVWLAFGVVFILMIGVVGNAHADRSRLVERCGVFVDAAENPHSTCVMRPIRLTLSEPQARPIWVLVELNGPAYLRSYYIPAGEVEALGAALREQTARAVYYDGDRIIKQEEL